ncbi:hypothetical protein MYSE111917_02585 [Mycobacterium senriense]|uniref:Uncharacterized protein n=1 Tax=Mycobacterium senriense TaxID=2775496 RepID=A0ABM7SUK7_9MYCO|nr:hypothetical protein [Mycobacterium senriense]BCZ21774.1 hypothetical protein MTY59_16290 [Mycobacterium senriense]
MFAVRVAEVVIGSPDNTDRFRAAIGQALNWWNAAAGQRHEIVLVPAEARRLNASAETAQIVDRGDIFIAVFDPARRDADQVMDEVDQAKHAGKLVLAWLLAESPSCGLSDQQAWLGDVTRRLARAGVIPRYVGRGDAHLESRLQTAITADLTHRNLSKLASEFERASPARRLRIYRTPVTLLGPQIWAVTVVNHSTSLVVGLQVSVGSVDSAGHVRPRGAERSRQGIADVAAKLRTGRWPDEHHPLSDLRGVLPERQPIFLGSRTDLLAAHNILDFPRWLRPNQHASALYSLEPNTSPHVRIQFEDDAGYVWSRVNDAEPEGLSPKSPSSGERRDSAIAGV